MKVASHRVSLCQAAVSGRVARPEATYVAGDPPLDGGRRHCHLLPRYFKRQTSHLNIPRQGSIAESSGGASYDTAQRGLLRVAPVVSTRIIKADMDKTRQYWAPKAFSGLARTLGVGKEEGSMGSSTADAIGVVRQQIMNATVI